MKFDQIKSDESDDVHWRFNLTIPRGIKRFYREIEYHVLISIRIHWPKPRIRIAKLNSSLGVKLNLDGIVNIICETNTLIANFSEELVITINYQFIKKATFFPDFLLQNPGRCLSWRGQVVD